MSTATMLIIATVVLMIASQVAASYIPWYRSKTADKCAHISYFQAHLSSDESYTGVSKVIGYDTVTVNRREAYDNATGIYTCPTTGLYSFTVEAFLHEDSPNRYAKIGIIHGVRNNTARVMMETAVLKVRLDYVSQTQTRSTYIELTKGDQVYVKTFNHFLLKRGYNQFSGREIVSNKVTARDLGLDWRKK